MSDDPVEEAKDLIVKMWWHEGKEAACQRAKVAVEFAKDHNFHDPVHDDYFDLMIKYIDEQIQKQDN